MISPDWNLKSNITFTVPLSMDGVNHQGDIISHSEDVPLIFGRKKSFKVQYLVL